MRQLSSALVVAQVLAAFPGAVLGIPLGLLLFEAAVKGSDGVPSPLWLIAMVVGILIAMATLMIVPARIGSMRSIVEVLQSETA